MFRTMLDEMLRSQLGWTALGSVFEEKLAENQLKSCKPENIFWTISREEAPPHQNLLRSQVGSRWIFLCGSNHGRVLPEEGYCIEKPNFSVKGSEIPLLSKLRNGFEPKPSPIAVAVELPTASVSPVFGSNPVHVMKTLKQGIFIGSSTGGPNALMTLLPGLASLEVPIFIAQHMPPKFTVSLAHSLSEAMKRKVKEGEAGERVQLNCVYLAPGGFHMTVERDSQRQMSLQISRDRPVHGCRPSVDVLFGSAAQYYGRASVAIMLTGMGEDGREGTRALKQNGVWVVAQDEKSSVVWGMPGSVVKAGLADAVLPLDRIAEAVVSQIKKGALLL